MKKRKQLFRRHRNSKIEKFKFELTFCMAKKIQQFFEIAINLSEFFLNYDFKKKPKVFFQFRQKKKNKIASAGTVNFYDPLYPIFPTPLRIPLYLHQTV